MAQAAVQASDGGDIGKQVRQVIARALDRPIEQIEDDLELREDLRVDSLTAISLALELESDLGIYLNDDDIENLTTVGDAVQLVQREINRK